MSADKTKISTKTASTVTVLATAAPRVIVVNTLDTSIGAGSGGGYINETTLNQGVL